MDDGNLGKTKRKIPLYDFLKKGGRASLFLSVIVRGIAEDKGKDLICCVCGWVDAMVEKT